MLQSNQLKLPSALNLTMTIPLNDSGHHSTTATKISPLHNQALLSMQSPRPAGTASPASSHALINLQSPRPTVSGTQSPSSSAHQHSGHHHNELAPLVKTHSGSHTGTPVSMFRKRLSGTLSSQNSASISYSPNPLADRSNSVSLSATQMHPHELDRLSELGLGGTAGSPRAGRTPVSGGIRKSLNSVHLQPMNG